MGVLNVLILIVFPVYITGVKTTQMLRSLHIKTICQKTIAGKRRYGLDLSIQLRLVKKAVRKFRPERELSSSFNENNYQNSYTINEVDDCIFIGFDTFLRR